MIQGPRKEAIVANDIGKFLIDTILALLLIFGLGLMAVALMGCDGPPQPPDRPNGLVFDCSCAWRCEVGALDNHGVTSIEPVCMTAADVPGYELELEGWLREDMVQVCVKRIAVACACHHDARAEGCGQ